MKRGIQEEGYRSKDTEVRKMKEGYRRKDTGGRIQK